MWPHFCTRFRFSYFIRAIRIYRCGRSLGRLHRRHCHHHRVHVWWECEWTSATVTCGTSYMHYSWFVPSNGRTWVLFVTHCALDAVCCVCKCKDNKTRESSTCMARTRQEKQKEENKWKQRSNSTGKRKRLWSMSFGAEESRCERWEKSL